MRKLTVVFGALLCLVLLTVACRQTATTDSAPDVTVEMVVEPAEPEVGQASLLITLLDSDDTPLDGATVTVRGDMAHAGMVPVTADAPADGDGAYRADFEWTMAGDWVVTVAAALPDGRAVMREFPLVVDNP